jgi:hypothetical protein
LTYTQRVPDWRPLSVSGKGLKVTPEELLGGSAAQPQWIHGRDVGVDEDGGLWVRADAELGALAPGVQPLGQRRVTQANFREYSILTPQGKTALDPRDRSEPVWKYVQDLEVDSIGSEWIAVDRRNTEREKERCGTTG